MTDGDNLISRIVGSANNSANAQNCATVSGRKYTSQYTGYGYISENRLGTTDLSNAETMLNNRLTQVCNNIKETGIIVFTIVFRLENTQLQKLFRDCATSPDKFFNSPDN